MSHRFDYNHVIDAKCPTCDAKVEDPEHYFLLCPTYAAARPHLLQGVSDILHLHNIGLDFRRKHSREFVISTLLKGSSLLDFAENINVFSLVQNYIQETHRFL
jgi:hypothetical protein